MTKAESHYLNCQDENCERFACVARRDFQSQIDELRGELRIYTTRPAPAIIVHEIYGESQYSIGSKCTCTHPANLLVGHQGACPMKGTP